MLESEFQLDVIRDLEKILPGCVVLKNDANYIQGFPDLTVLYRDKWAVLETKSWTKAKYRPNQKYYVEMLNNMSFSASIYPENKEEVLDDLQRAFGIRRPTRLSKRE